MRTMKLPPAIYKFVTNKIVLNVVTFLAFFNVVGYLVMGNLNLVMYFAVIACLIRYFSKKMTIVLGVPLLIINLLSFKGVIKEGMETATTKVKETVDKVATKVKGNDKNKDKLDKKTGQGLSMNTVSESTDNAAQNGGGEQQGFESGRKKTRGYEIDYATTIEDAYDELNGILGSDGIQRLTSDTQSLMKQQMQLAEAMKGMGPVIKQIAPMVENLKGMMGSMGSGKEGLGGIMDMAKQMSA